MTHEEFIELIKHPEKVGNGNISDLKEIIDLYPYFSHPKYLHAKALQSSRNIQASKYIKLSAIYCSDKRWLYYYLYPEKKPADEKAHYERIPRYFGNYFDLLENVESETGDTRTSLKNLAERLKAAREMVTGNDILTPIKATESIQNITPKVEMALPDYFSEIIKNEDINEATVKKLIQERKYHEAIEILKKLNLIIPKKSVYFAVQIRFLEKVIENTKK
ncbi:MAG TPA: hypothetical protein P5084_12185 [Paludibacter sp.]|nr:hypothetical protein [Paludibacter sp.]